MYKVDGAIDKEDKIIKGVYGHVFGVNLVEWLETLGYDLAENHRISLPGDGVYYEYKTEDVFKDYNEDDIKYLTLCSLFNSNWAIVDSRIFIKEEEPKSSKIESKDFVNFRKNKNEIVFESSEDGSKTYEIYDNDLLLTIDDKKILCNLVNIKHKDLSYSVPGIIFNKEGEDENYTLEADVYKMSEKPVRAKKANNEYACIDAQALRDVVLLDDEDKDIDNDFIYFTHNYVLKDLYDINVWELDELNLKVGFLDEIKATDTVEGNHLADEDDNYEQEEYDYEHDKL